MGFRRTYVGVGLGLALVAGSIGVAVAQGAGNPFENRPFRGTSEGTSAVVGIQNGVVMTESEGTFIASHLGRGTYEAELVQDYARHPDPQCAFVSGDIELTAANGDELRLRTDAPGMPGNPQAQGRSVVCAPEDQPPTGPEEGDIYLSTLYLDVVGGTGRFADASGWVFSRGTSEVQENVTETVDAAAMLGDIDY
jgi:hypothetical protein